MATGDQLIIQKNVHAKPVRLDDGPFLNNEYVRIGTAVKKRLKDIRVRSKTMQGLRTPYIPDWGCHTLPIEHKRLKELPEKKADFDSMPLRKVRMEYSKNVQKSGILNLNDSLFLPTRKMITAP
jgi:isoleucyl-tRNA synthetase